MPVRTTIRIPDEIYDKIKSSSYHTTSECIIQALVQFFENSSSNKSMIVYSEEMGRSLSFLQNFLEESKKYNCSLEDQLKVKDNQLKLKDEQLKTKDQQIFSLIAVQKDLIEKTMEQIKLLASQSKNKKWYEFWK